jgi:hypothetical protein
MSPICPLYGHFLRVRGVHEAAESNGAGHLEKGNRSSTN